MTALGLATERTLKYGFLMKITLEIPDELYWRVKAAAALSGRTVRELCTEALREKLERKQAGALGWRVAFGRAPRDAVDEVQRIVDEELERVDPADWR